MALQERTRNYEILIRFNEDGSIGAHRQNISEIIKDGAVIAASVLTPEPLTVAELTTIVAEFSE